VIVLDASIAIELLLDADVGRRAAEGRVATSASLHAPHVIDLEVAQVARRLVRDGVATAQRGRELLEDLRDLEIERYPHDVLLERIWQLRDRMTAYDAAYVALAEALGAPLVTCDARLSRAAGDLVEVELVS